MNCTGMSQILYIHIFIYTLISVQYFLVESAIMTVLSTKAKVINIVC